MTKEYPIKNVAAEQRNKKDGPVIPNPYLALRNNYRVVEIPRARINNVLSNME